MFERYGFKVLNRAEITKYKAFLSRIVTSSVIKELGDRPDRIPFTTRTQVNRELREHRAGVSVGSTV